MRDEEPISLDDGDDEGGDRRSTPMLVWVGIGFAAIITLVGTYGLLSRLVPRNGEPANKNSETVASETAKAAPETKPKEDKKLEPVIAPISQAPMPQKPDPESSVFPTDIGILPKTDPYLFNDNPIAAEAKFKDKWIKDLVQVETIGRTRDGLPYIGSWCIGNLKRAEPNAFYIFDKSDEMQIFPIRVGDGVTIVGLCQERTDDGIFRQLKGWEWHVKILHCRVIPDPKK